MKKIDNIRDSQTIWHYVIWAPHTFFALIFFLFLTFASLSVIFSRTNGRDRISDETGVLIAILIAIFGSLIYWVPCALGGYAHLRLVRRRQTLLDRQWEEIQSGESEVSEQGGALNEDDRAPLNKSNAPDWPS